MSEWLDDARLDVRPAAVAGDYGCRDDYGLTIDHTSAWAGLFYFAAPVPPRSRSAALPVLAGRQRPACGPHVRELRGHDVHRLRLGCAVADIVPHEATTPGREWMWSLSMMKNSGCRGFVPSR